jgi:hypothetical protein
MRACARASERSKKPPTAGCWNFAEVAIVEEALELVVVHRREVSLDLAEAVGRAAEVLGEAGDGVEVDPFGTAREVANAHGPGA